MDDREWDAVPFQNKNPTHQLRRFRRRGRCHGELHARRHARHREKHRATSHAESDVTLSQKGHRRTIAATHPWASRSNAEANRCRCHQSSKELVHRHLRRRRNGVRRSLRIHRPGLSQNPCATCHRSWSRPIRLPEVLVLYVARPCRCAQHDRV